MQQRTHSAALSARKPLNSRKDSAQKPVDSVSENERKL